MNDHPPAEEVQPPAVIGHAAHDNTEQPDLFPAAAFLQIERQRIDSYNRRTEVASQAVAASNEADKRQFEFQMAKLVSSDSSAQRRDSLARILAIAISVSGISIVGLFLGMAFFGNAHQSEVALQILKVLAVGGGGYGVISGMINVVQRLMRDRSSS